MEGSDARERAASAVRATGTGASGARLSALSPSARLALLDDERLALLASRGSKRGFAGIRDRYQQPLYAYCYLLLRDADAAYDALQATFARALAEMREGARDELLRPWLFRIANQQAHQLARGGAPNGAARFAMEQVWELRDAPGERARLAQLAGDLSELPVVQRSALLMRELTGLRHAEIASALGISRPAVRQAIFLARRSLSEFQLGRSLACEEVCRTLSHGDGRALRRRTLRAHLRSCSACAEFARAVEARRTELPSLNTAQ
jgi:RNA polymerase sigma factor (sigma-70 family)